MEPPLSALIFSTPVLLNQKINRSLRGGEFIQLRK
jgi:hypothetical protein